MSVGIMNLLRLACLMLSLATVLPPEALAKDSNKLAESGAESRSGKTEKRSKLDRALRNQATLSGKTRVIIRHRSDKSDNVQQDVKKRGGRFIKKNRRGIVAELSPKALAELAADSSVEGISLDAPMAASQLLSGTTSTLTDTTSTLTSTTTTVSSTTNTLESYLASFDAQATRKTLGIKLEDFGYDIGVAIIDSGIAPTPDIAWRISAFYDFTQGGIRTTPSDGYGHGTHIA